MISFRLLRVNVLPGDLAHHFIITIAYPLITSSDLEGENREMKDES